MKNTARHILPVLLVATFTFAGCAKQQVVNRDEPIVNTITKNETSVTPSQPTSTTGRKQHVEPAKAESAPQQGIAVTQQNVPAQSATTADLEKALQKVYFNLDSYVLDDAARAALANNLDVLHRYPQLKIRIEGHCDERGSDEYNLALGERRAQAAARYLSALGVGPERLSVISYGEEKPADPGHDEAGWNRNRRDEFTVH